MQVRSNYRYDIAILRLVSIIIIVFFHAYGMTYLHFSDDVNKLYSDVYRHFNESYLINLAMPMFVVISGYLYGRQLIANKYADLKSLVKDKFRRIMIPFFFFSIFFMLTTNSFSFHFFYRWAFWHLWFLPMLFWCFIISFIFRKILLKDNVLLNLCILFVLFSISTFGVILPKFLGLHNVSLWLCWFVMGIYLTRYSDNIFHFIQRYHLIGVLIAANILLNYKFYRIYGVYDYIGIFTIILGILSLLYIFNRISWTNLKCLPFLLHLSSLSFGVYIYHNWLELYMVSTTAKAYLNIEEFAANHVYLYPFLFSMTAYILSVLLTEITLRVKIGRFLIG